MTSRTLLKICGAGCVLSILISATGCNTIPKRTRDPLPETLANKAVIPGIPNARFWGDETPPFIEELLQMRNDQVAERYPKLVNRKVDVLAISGGGQNGAYTTGLMVGWTAKGDRPDFMIVNGISTGAIVAPFVFLGPDYDDVLLSLYTQYDTAAALDKRNLLMAITRDAFFDTAPLRRIISGYLTDDVVRRIAKEHRSGRRLWIGTVNIDAMRPVTWDIGQIAISDHPHKRELIIDLVMASSAIPCALPPVFIDVEADGKVYQEMHVDGGIYSQIMTGSIAYHRDDVMKKLNAQGTLSAYVIRNARVESDWEEVKPTIPSIAARSVSSMIRTQGIDNLKQLYLTAKRDHFDIYLTSIPADFKMDSKEMFDLNYMSALVDEGYRLITEGDPWITTLD